MEKFGVVVLGAHTGFHIKPEILKCADKKVLLVEPVPYNIVEIKKNLSEFKNILIEPITISDKGEIKKFYHLNLVIYFVNLLFYIKENIPPYL